MEVIIKYNTIWIKHIKKCENNITEINNFSLRK